MNNNTTSRNGSQVKVPEGDTELTITFYIGKYREWLFQNCEDFAWALNKELRKHGNGIADGFHGKRVFTVLVHQSTPEVVQPYLDAFVKEMRKDGTRFSCLLGMHNG